MNLTTTSSKKERKERKGKVHNVKPEEDLEINGWLNKVWSCRHMQPTGLKPQWLLTNLTTDGLRSCSRPDTVCLLPAWRQVISSRHSPFGSLEVRTRREAICDNFVTGYSLKIVAHCVGNSYVLNPKVFLAWIDEQFCNLLQPTNLRVSHLSGSAPVSDTKSLVQQPCLNTHHFPLCPLSPYLKSDLNPGERKTDTAWKGDYQRPDFGLCNIMMIMCRRVVTEHFLVHPFCSQASARSTALHTTSSTGTASAHPIQLLTSYACGSTLTASLIAKHAHLRPRHQRPMLSHAN